MKRILMTLMMLMCLLGVSAQVVYIYKSDANGNTIGSSVYSTSTSKQDVKIVVDRTSPKFKVYKVDADGNTVGNPVYSTDEMVKAVYAQNALDPHASDYVDLGLSVYWGTKNIGANQIYDIGSYYMWGMTSVMTSCTWATYEYGTSESNLTKYNTKKSYELDYEDDAAYCVWGESWRMPTQDEITELINSCNWTWATISGQEGYKVSNKTDASKYIFLPVTGGKSGSTIAETNRGYYWSCNCNKNASKYGYALSFSSEDKSCAEKMRNLGFCIRPVKDKEQ